MKDVNLEISSIRVVQDLATQWLQSYPCKSKSSQETQESLMKFLEPTRNNSLEFGKSCEELINHPGIIVRQCHTDQKHMGLQKEQCAE